MLVLGLVSSLLVGVLLGLLGGGGSILAVPVLHFWFGVGAHAAIAMSLVVVAVTSAVATIAHAQRGRVQWRAAFAFGAGSLATAYLGGVVGAHVPGRALLVAFAALMLVIGTLMFLRDRRPATLAVRRPSATKLAIAGAVVGFLTGLLGVGGGFLIVPALTLVGGVAITDAIGTSLFLIALNATAGLAGTGGEHIDAPLVALVTGLSLVGSVLGARLGDRLDPRQLQCAFGALVIVVAIASLASELL